MNEWFTALMHQLNLELGPELLWLTWLALAFGVVRVRIAFVDYWEEIRVEECVRPPPPAASPSPRYQRPSGSGVWSPPVVSPCGSVGAHDQMLSLCSKHKRSIEVCLLRA